MIDWQQHRSPKRERHLTRICLHWEQEIPHSISNCKMDEIQVDKKQIRPTESSTPDYEVSKLTTIDDYEVEDFYGSSTTKAYRLKSELVGKCLEEIGMGWYSLLSILSSWLRYWYPGTTRFQWKLFVVTGFGWIVDNVCKITAFLLKSLLLTYTSNSLHHRALEVSSPLSSKSSLVSSKSATVPLRIMLASFWVLRFGVYRAISLDASQPSIVRYSLLAYFCVPLLVQWTSLHSVHFGQSLELQPVEMCLLIRWYF